MANEGSHPVKDIDIYRRNGRWYIAFGTKAGTKMVTDNSLVMDDAGIRTFHNLLQHAIATLGESEMIEIGTPRGVIGIPMPSVRILADKCAYRINQLASGQPIPDDSWVSW